MYQEESIKITWETKRVVDFGISHIASSMPGMWVSVVALEFFRTLPNGFQGGFFNNQRSACFSAADFRLICPPV